MRCRHATWAARAVALACAGLMSCARAAPGGAEDSDSFEPDDSDRPDTESETDTDTEETVDPAIAVAVEASVVRLYVRTEVESQFMGGPFPPGTLALAHVEPGAWWVLADGGGDTCDRSETMELTWGDVLYWTVTDFPGQKEGLDCVLP